MFHRLQVAALGFPFGDVRSNLEYAHHPPTVHHGVVGGLQPQCVAIAVPPLEHPGKPLASAQAIPKPRVFRRLRVVGVAQLRVVGPAQVFGPLEAKHTRKRGIAAQDAAVDTQLHHGVARLQRLHVGTVRPPPHRHTSYLLH